MFNLLSPQDQAVLAQEFRFRGAAVALCLFSVLALAGAASLAPSLFLLTQKEDIARRQVEALSRNASAVADAQFEKGLSLVNARLALLSRKAPSVQFSEVIKTAVASLPREITLDRVSIAENSQQGYTASLGGTAVKRSSLVAFAQALEKLRFFDSVSLPISYLVKDTDILFSLSLEGSRR